MDDLEAEDDEDESFDEDLDFVDLVLEADCDLVESGARGGLAGVDLAGEP